METRGCENTRREGERVGVKAEQAAHGVPKSWISDLPLTLCWRTLMSPKNEAIQYDMSRGPSPASSSGSNCPWGKYGYTGGNDKSYNGG